MPQLVVSPEINRLPFRPASLALRDSVLNGKTLFEKYPSDYLDYGFVDIPATVFDTFANSIVNRLSLIPEGPERDAFISHLASVGLGPDGLPLPDASLDAVKDMMAGASAARKSPSYSIGELGYGASDAPEGTRFSSPSYGTYGSINDILRLVNRSLSPGSKSRFGLSVPVNDTYADDPTLRGVKARFDSNTVGSGNINVASPWNIYRALREAGDVVDLRDFYRNFGWINEFFTDNAFTGKARALADSIVSKFINSANESVSRIKDSSTFKDLVGVWNDLYGRGNAAGDVNAAFGFDTAESPVVDDSYALKPEDVSLENYAVNPGSRIEVSNGRVQYRPADSDQLINAMAQQNGGISGTIKLGGNGINLRMNRDPQTGSAIPDSDLVTSEEFDLVPPDARSAAAEKWNGSNDSEAAAIRQILHAFAGREKNRNK